MTMQTNPEDFVPDGKTTVGDKVFMGDGKGGLTPVDLIKPQHLLEDETVRKIIGFAAALSAQVARFKEHTFEDIGAFEALLAQEYGTTVGGQKGNKTLQSVDGLFKVQVQVADHVDFGPELQIAKGLVDECLNEWAADARAEIRAIVTRAFNTDKLDIEDERWKRAMQAIRDAMRIVGSKTYVRCYRRERFDAPWQAISIDLARA